MPYWVDDEGKQHLYNPPPELFPRPKKLALQDAFTKPRRTLKLEIAPGISVVDAIESAMQEVTKPDTETNRIEFKHGRCYIVVARLKD